MKPFLACGDVAVSEGHVDNGGDAVMVMVMVMVIMVM